MPFFILKTFFFFWKIINFVENLEMKQITRGQGKRGGHVLCIIMTQCVHKSSAHSCKSYSFMTFNKLVKKVTKKSHRWHSIQVSWNLSESRTLNSFYNGFYLTALSRQYITVCRDANFTWKFTLKFLLIVKYWKPGRHCKCG